MDFKNLDLIDVIDSVVDSMRETGTYTAVYSGDYSTLTADNTFSNYDVVIINDVSYTVTDVTDTSFKVKADVTAFTNYKAAAPYYEYGHILEIAQSLAKKDNASGVTRFKKYPLIMLLLDVPATPNKLWKTFDYTNVKIVIVDKTDKNYTAPDRKVNVFEPVLIPLYERFIEELSKSKLTNNKDNIPFIQHTKIDRYFWGTELNGNSTKNIVNDFLDAVEIQNLNIKVKQINC